MGMGIPIRAKAAEPPNAHPMLSSRKGEGESGRRQHWGSSLLGLVGELYIFT